MMGHLDVSSSHARNREREVCKHLADIPHTILEILRKTRKDRWMRGFLGLVKLSLAGVQNSVLPLERV